MIVIFWACLAFILYTYMGYPVSLFFLAKLRRKPKTYPPISPKLTLFILAYNEEAVIARKIENTLDLDYPKDQLQIIVVTDGSNDQTVNIVKKYERRGITLSHTPLRKGKSAAINRTLPLAEGDIVLFSDANNMYVPEALQYIVAPFQNPTVGGVTGVKRILKEEGPLGESEGLYWRYESFIREQETRLGCCTGVIGEMFAIRRNLLVPPTSRIINDDFFMALKIMQKGYRLVYVPEACSYERISVSAKDEVERRSRIIAGRYQLISMAHKLLPLKQPMLVWQIVSHKFFRPLVPFAMMGALWTNAIAVLWPNPMEGHSFWHLSPPAGWIFLGLQGLFYGVAFLGNYLKSEGLLGKIAYLPLFLVNSNIAALNGLYLFISGRQTPLWNRVPRRGENDQT